MHILTLVANSTLLNYIGRNYRTVLRAGIVGMVLTRQWTMNNQRLNVTANRLVGLGGVLLLEWKVTLLVFE